MTPTKRPPKKVTPDQAARDALKTTTRNQTLAEAEVVNARQKRDQAIRAAHAQGVTKMEIHRATGLSRPTIDKILSEGGTTDAGGSDGKPRRPLPHETSHISRKRQGIAVEFARQRAEQSSE